MQMKIVITGSLGNIGKPLAEKLFAHGHSVTVISSNPEKQQQMYKGNLASDFYKNKPNLGKVKLEDFASDFVRVYHETTN